MNLPRLGILSNNDIDKFFELLTNLLEECKNSLLYRKDVLSNLKVKDLPFIAGQELFLGSEGLKETDSILPILEQGTYGMGFVGLAETLVALLGVHHGQTLEARELGEKINGFIREKADYYTTKYSLNFSAYASPAEEVSGKLCKSDIKKFGIIEGVNDKEFYTNGFHIPVDFPISIMNKIQIEAPYHKMCNGGHISYIEVDDYPTPKLVEKVVTKSFTETNIAYIGINFHIRYCKECGTLLHGESKCDCGSTSIQGISRLTGYLGLDERFGETKSKERSLRINHNSDHAKVYNNVKK